MRSPLEIVQTWYAKLDRSLIHPDIDWYIVEGYPNGGYYRGSRAVFEEFLPSLTASFDFWTAEVEELLDAGDCITALGYYRGRVKGNPAEFTIPFAHIWWVQAEQIVKVRGYADTLKLHQQLGTVGFNSGE